MIFFKYLILFIILCFPVWKVEAGDHRGLCEKVGAAELVFEMAFDVKGAYPKAYQQKGWSPPESELLKIAKTGKVTKVFKGEIQNGNPWTPAFGIIFNQGSRLEAWKSLFQKKQFSVIAFLKKKENHYQTTGWAEETAGCQHSAHFSWCFDYSTFQRQILECLK